MSQEVARSGTSPVPVGLGWSSLLYRFWSIQIDSLTEFASGSRVSTRTALAITRVSLVAVVPGVVPPPPPLEQPAAATAIVTAARLSVRGQEARSQEARSQEARGQEARSMRAPHFVDCRQRVSNVRRCPGSVNSSPLLVIRTVTSAYWQLEAAPRAVLTAALP